MKHICDQTNLYATQNRREFAANPEEVHVILGINLGVDFKVVKREVLLEC